MSGSAGFARPIVFRGELGRPSSALTEWMKSFPHASFGPVQLRPLMRARLLPGERLVGWRLVQLDPSPLDHFTDAALWVVPGAGWLAALAMSVARASRRRFVVLSDRRLLVLGLGKSSIHPLGRGVELDVQLAACEVTTEVRRHGGKRSQDASAGPHGAASHATIFAVRPAGGPPMRWRVAGHSTPAAERLRQGLALLVDDAQTVLSQEEADV